jgi:protocatechuate 3,4-dioxygenase beta subunit
MHRFFVALAFVITASSSAQVQREPIVGLPCEGCEAVFEGMPARLTSRARIAPQSEPGIPMTVAGQVLDANGRPAAGIVVYAYQTDSKGIYPAAPEIRDPQARRHGKLRAWVKSDATGRYSFDTIRPASYPNTDLPEHIHLHVIEPGCSTYYIDDILFTDDTKLTPTKISRMTNHRGGNGISTPIKKDGVWNVSRDIHLGKNIPGYRACKG